MKKILAVFIYFLIFIFSLIIFLPKESLYNLVESELAKKEVVISNETRDEKLFGLIVSNGDIFFQGLNIVKFENFSFSSYLFISNITINNASIVENFSSMVPSPISTITFEHFITSFNKIKIKGNGVFGNVTGELDIFTKSLKLQLTASDEMKSKYSKILKSMKLENGVYIYEYKF